jgi:SPP1 gp7 family putative phage head morphogenesis protein
MKWGAHEVDGRLAAKNAIKLRAALQEAANWKRIFEAYKRTQPATSKNPAQDRARARAWAMLNIRFDNEALLATLRRIWADGFALGIVSAEDAVRRARELKKADEPEYIDWKNWKPGDSAAALLVKPTRAFQRLLESAGVTIRGIDQTGYDRMGTALSDALALGLSGDRAAKLIRDTVSDPARALTIAITETNRAISRATIERYQGYGIEKVEWATSSPCDICRANEGQVVNLGSAFNSGATQPPQHPNCRCALLPVIPDDEQAVNAAGVVDIMPSEPSFQGITASTLLEVRRRGDKAMNDPRAMKGADDLSAAYEVAGYNGLPRVVAAKEFDELAKTADVKVYRGIKGTQSSNPIYRKSAQDLIDEYKYGEHYAGYGVFGNGTYTTTKLSTAIKYADDKKDGVMEILVMDKSKFPNQEDLKNRIINTIHEIDVASDLAYKEMIEEATRQGLTVSNLEDSLLYKDYAKKKQEFIEMRITISDPGTAATLWGYDGFRLMLDTQDEYFYVVLNRAKVVIKE